MCISQKLINLLLLKVTTLKFVNERKFINIHWIFSYMHNWHLNLIVN